MNMTEPHTARNKLTNTLLNIWDLEVSIRIFDLFSTLYQSLI